MKTELMYVVSKDSNGHDYAVRYEHAAVNAACELCGKSAEYSSESYTDLCLNCAIRGLGNDGVSVIARTAEAALAKVAGKF